MSKNLSLREMREQLGMTQQELADALGMARAYISAVERGANPFSEKFRNRVKNLSFASGDISVSGNNGAVAVASPGAKVHNTAAPQPVQDKPPVWAVAIEARLSGEIKSLREQLADIQALLVKLASK